MSHDLVITCDGLITFDLEHLTGRCHLGERFVIRRVELVGVSRIPLSARMDRRAIVDALREFVGRHRVYDYDNTRGYVNVCLDNTDARERLTGIMVEAEVMGD